MQTAKSTAPHSLVGWMYAWRVASPSYGILKSVRTVHHTGMDATARYESEIRPVLDMMVRRIVKGFDPVRIILPLLLS